MPFGILMKSKKALAHHNSKILTYNRWCALPPKKALATRSPYSLPKYMFLDLPRDVIRSFARFRLCVHTSRKSWLLIQWG